MTDALRTCNRCQECRCPEHFCKGGFGVEGMGHEAAWRKTLDDVRAFTEKAGVRFPSIPQVEYVRPGQKSGQERALGIIMDAMREEIEAEIIGAFAVPEELLLPRAIPPIR